MEIGVTGRDPFPIPTGSTGGGGSPKGGWVYGGTIPGASMLSRVRPWGIPYMVVRCVTLPIGVVTVIVSECSLLSSMR